MATFNIRKIHMVCLKELGAPNCDICGFNCSYPIMINKKYKIDNTVLCECAHSFHKQCIENNENICNICKTPIIIKKII